MGFIDHIRSCNNHDLSKFVSFLDQQDNQIGWIRKDRLDLLRSYDHVFEIKAETVCLLSPEGMDAVCRDLYENGVLAHWRDEPYAVNQRFGDAPICLIERCAVPFFGMRAYGVHINGFVKTAEGIKMWIGKRATDRAICPGMLDNMVAGGQPAGLSLMENIIKEAAEEANVPEDLAKQAKPVGTVSYLMETDNGIKPDVMFCYDLEVPESFTPVNTDGETEEFYLMPISEVAEIVRDRSEFKFNCNLVIIDFLIRHGVINPDNEPDYEELVRGLRA